MNRRLQANDARNSHACSHDATGYCRLALPHAAALFSVAREAGRCVAWHWRALLLMMALGATHHAHAVDAARRATEAGVKAAYLYKFATYVEWPLSTFARPDAPFTIGIVGADDIAAELGKIRAAGSGSGRAMEVKVLRPGDPATGVHILFFGQHEAARLGRLLGLVSGLPLLMVTENSGGLDSGSTIDFVMVDDRIRFEVSLSHAERSNIKISVRLLNVALRVEAKKP